MPTISSLHWYPVKSCGGLAVDRLNLDKRGACGDRRWMMIDDRNVFITARQQPRLLTLDTAIRDGRLWLDGPASEESIALASLLQHEPGENPVQMSPLSLTDTRLLVRIWNDLCEAVCLDQEINERLSTMLGFSCRLVYMPAETTRMVEQGYIAKTPLLGTRYKLGFADGYQLLLTNEASLDALNERLEKAVPMSRFRPNVVVTGAPAFDEDDWYELLIGDDSFYGVKNCARCAIITMDPAAIAAGTEAASDRKEPLRTLAGFRRRPGGLMFGQNLVMDEHVSALQRGLELQVISKLPASAV